MQLSIISPVYMGEPHVEELVRRITDSVSSFSNEFEIILVEDGSPDKSWEAINMVCQKYPQVRGVKLSRNFGQHYAITAGLTKAKGEWVVVLDCDLQDRPEEIPNLFKLAKEGNDLVFARRYARKDSFIKRLSSRIFYKIFSYLTDTRQDPGVANFGIYHKDVIRAVLSMKDHIRYFPTMTQWVGFRKTSLNVEHSERKGSESSYSWKRLFKLAFDNIVAFSDKPLRITVRLGFLISFSALFFGLYYLILYLSGNIAVLGFTSLIISIWFLSGLIIFILGIIGIYLGKVFDRVKDRPTFIIEKEIGDVS